VDYQRGQEREENKRGSGDTEYLLRRENHEK